MKTELSNLLRKKKMETKKQKSRENKTDKTPGMSTFAMTNPISLDSTRAMPPDPRFQYSMTQSVHPHSSKMKEKKKDQDKRKTETTLAVDEKKNTNR